MSRNQNKSKTPGTIIDVRSRMEFGFGHVPQSLNIPLNKLGTRIEEIRQMKKPIVLCCASGNRSGMALNILNQHGIIDARNGGGWRQVKAEYAN